MPACADTAHVWAKMLADFNAAGILVQAHPENVPAVGSQELNDAKAGFAAMAVVNTEISKYTPVS